ncbi:estradiol 17-beta-dehydrogenase [Plectosphaerella plurivora]|uniref:Estradiol 17-beta-dehydrogenase n=1 Tax=Plectosphaerella plurivora TaxID=936078 RepID=A0A9P9ABD2_9PEZI|nr:estradiol 17-beta-dehydrogenase [Plectosphaerella plurivora]
MSSPVWFITGASSGFGFEIAKLALSNNHKVIAAARSASKLQPLADLGADIIVLDVTAPEADVRAAIDRAHALYGRLTHVVNSAGYILEGFTEEQTAEDVRAMYETNVFGTHKVSRAAAPYLRAQGSGSIVNFGSIGSWEGGANCAHYCATKAAVSIFSEGLAQELSPFGVGVVVVEPGYFRTSFLNPGARLAPSAPVAAYHPEGGSVFDGVDNNQPGDPVAGSRVVYEVVTGGPAAGGRKLPVRLVIGSDCVAGIRKKCDDTQALLNEWESVASSTDYPK